MKVLESKFLGGLQRGKKRKIRSEYTVTWHFITQPWGLGPVNQPCPLCYLKGPVAGFSNTCCPIKAASSATSHELISSAE